MTQAEVQKDMASIRPVRNQSELAVEVFKAVEMVGRDAVTNVIREPKPRTDSPMNQSNTHRYGKAERESCGTGSCGSTRQTFGCTAEGLRLTPYKYVGFRPFFYIILDFRFFLDF